MLVRLDTGSKAETLNMLVQIAKKSFCYRAGVSDKMSAIEVKDAVLEWSIALIKCDICHFEALTIFPAMYNDDSIFKCSNCKNTSSYIMEQ